MKNSKTAKGSTAPKNASSSTRGANFNVRQNDMKSRENQTKPTLRK